MSSTPDTTPVTTPAPRFIVRCEDGRIRHLHDTTVEHGSFPNRLAAATWAEWGHVCTARHTIERIVPVGAAGCIVLPGIDGPSLWDCECTSCVAIQDDYYASQDEGPSCSICDALGHGYPGGPPCPLEDRGYDTDGVWR